MAESRRERERVLGDYRRQADEKKEFKEKVERRVRFLVHQNLNHSSLVHSPSSSASHPPTTPVDTVSLCSVSGGFSIVCLCVWPTVDSSLDSSLQEEQEEKISSYEEALAKIKDTTGVSDILEVVARFLNQGDTRAHLEQLQTEHSQSLAHLQEEKERLQAQFEEMKYSGEAKMSS